jgi:serine/threonine protein kinase
MLPSLSSSESAAIRCEKARVRQYIQQPIRYEQIKELGRGEYGKVSLVREKKNGRLWACKEIKVTAKNAKFVQREIDILEQLGGHPHILQLEEVYEIPSNDVPDETVYFLITNYVPNGDLWTFFSDPSSHAFLWQACVLSNLFCQLISALQIMHDKGFVHRDIKLENLLLDGSNYLDLKLIISDFGFSCDIKQLEKDPRPCGSSHYVALEVLFPDLGKWSYPADIWAAGVCFYGMLFRCLPFEPKNIFKKVSMYDQSIIRDDELKELFAGLFRKDPTERLTPAEILKHPWITRQQSLYKSFIARRRKREIPILSVEEMVASRVAQKLKYRTEIKTQTPTKPPRLLTSVTGPKKRRPAKNIASIFDDKENWGNELSGLTMEKIKDCHPL